MPATILDGKSIANAIRAEIAAEVAIFKASSGITPSLATVLVGVDLASQLYVRNKQKACEQAGMRGVHRELPATTTQAELLEVISKLNADRSIHGILVQLPLSKQIDEQAVLDVVDQLKDVDCFHPHNVGLLEQGRPRFLPCTPHGVQQLLHRSGVPVAGKHVVIVGRSDIVGKPLAMLLMQRDSAPPSPCATAARRTWRPSRGKRIFLSPRSARRSSSPPTWCGLARRLLTWASIARNPVWPVMLISPASPPSLATSRPFLAVSAH
jgi:methylenetetrahydrofolate dehydrogenase (NADP+)/methenyltetrahydrofolate cyclohydrolase